MTLGSVTVHPLSSLAAHPCHGGHRVAPGTRRCRLQHRTCQALQPPFHWDVLEGSRHHQALGPQSARCEAGQCAGCVPPGVRPERLGKCRVGRLGVPAGGLPAAVRFRGAVYQFGFVPPSSGTPARARPPLPANWSACSSVRGPACPRPFPGVSRLWKGRFLCHEGGSGPRCRSVKRRLTLQTNPNGTAEKKETLDSGGTSQTGRWGRWWRPAVCSPRGGGAAVETPGKGSEG